MPAGTTATTKNPTQLQIAKASYAHRNMPSPMEANSMPSGLIDMGVLHFLIFPSTG